MQAAAPAQTGRPWPAPQGPREQGSEGGHEEPATPTPTQRLTCPPRNLTRPQAEQTARVPHTLGNRLIGKEVVNELPLGYGLKLRAGPSLSVITKNDSLSNLESFTVLGKVLLLHVELSDLTENRFFSFRGQ